MVPSGMPGEWNYRASPPSPGSGLVLIVDDETPVLLALRRILEGDRHRVALASSPAEAACALGDPALDVVLVDLGMGEASGLELLEQVKRERPEVEVIVMTGHASVDSAVDCMRRGAFDYLSKPFENLRRVRDTVGHAVERRRLAASEGGRTRERAASAAPGGDARRALPVDGSTHARARASAHGPIELPLSLDAYEKSALERALRESAGDAGEAARRLGIGRSTFYRKLAKHGIGDERGAEGPRPLGPGGVGSHSSIG